MFKTLIFSLFISGVLSAAFDDGQIHFESRTVDIPLKPYNPNATEAEDGVDNNRGGRVSGGKSAVDGQFPFIVEINTYKFGTTGYSLCTGSLITQAWTLTALHCTMADTPEPDPIYVIYGAVSRSSSKRRTVGVNALVYLSTADARIDMALLRHEYPIQLSFNVGLAQIPRMVQEHSYFNGVTATQAGYGAFKDVQYHQLTLNSNAVGCPPLNGFEREGICAQSKTGTSNSEGGDSGSPYFIYENSKPTIVGVHWGRSGGVHLATRVSSFIKFISETVGLPLR